MEPEWLKAFKERHGIEEVGDEEPCPHFRQDPRYKRKMCIYYLKDNSGVCTRPDKLMCAYWLEKQGKITVEV
jgi:hypothetical protein